MSPSKIPQHTQFDDVFLQAFCELLGARLGLQIRVKDRDSVGHALTGRAGVLGMGAADYLRHLRRENVEGPEWTHLMPLLTNGESYFERDKGQFALLRDTILPELIEGRQRQGRGDRTLRLWSAGCSTGEEAYTLAMTTAAALPPGWKATITGTDINLESLQKARRGIYGSWSFRGVETTTRDRYFRPVAGGYEVASELRARVTFGFCNLSANDWPDAARGIADMDLIICRNVLIYFQRPVVAEVLARFARTLRTGGFLLTGHAELHDQNTAPLRARLFPSSTAYQKEELPPIAPTPIRLPASERAPRLAPRPSPTRPSQSVIPTRPSLPPTSASVPVEKTADEWCALAQRHADSGRYEDAVQCCRDAIARNPSHADAYALWAHIADEQGQRGEAKELLKKVIYLAPMRPEAYVELAAIYQSEGDSPRARQMRVSALKLLQSLPSALSDHAELIHHLQEMLGENETPIPDRGERR